MTRLDKAIAALGHPHVQVLIVSDGVGDDDWPGNPIDDILKAQWPDYDVHSPDPAGSHSITYRSPQAEARFADHHNVAIRIEFLTLFR